MLIQALCRYYNKNMQRISDGVPQYFEKVGISHMVFLCEDGTISSIVDVRERKQTEKNGKIKETVSKNDMNLPVRSQKPGIDLNLAEHRPLYIFGLNYDKGVFTDADKTDKAKKSHACFTEGSLAFCEGLDSPIVNAFKAFLQCWNPAEETENEHLLQLGKEYATASFCFALTGHPEILLHEDTAFCEKYRKQKAAEETNTQTDCVTAMCPIEGEILPVARIHDQIKKGIRGGSTMGMALVGYNEESFESYQKEQSYNSNISETAMKHYTVTLNYLLTSSEHHLYLEDMTLIYFALSSDDQRECDVFARFLMHKEENTAAESADLRAALETVVKDMQRGVAADITAFDPNADFVIVGVTPNSSRIAVKFLLRGAFGQVMQNLLQHQQDLQIGDAATVIPMWQLCKELVSPKESNAAVPPPLQSALMLAVLNGTRYPDAMLHTVIRRLKVDESMGARHGALKVGMLKAYLNRKARFAKQKEEITLALNTENRNPAYLCGRLFAVLERIQQQALGDTNRTIKDAFFASACARPVSVFPRLLKLAQNHLAKLENDIYWQKLLGEITDSLEGEFPSTMPPDDQGRFIIGYYQQRQAFFAGKSTETQKG